MTFEDDLKRKLQGINKVLDQHSNDCEGIGLYTGLSGLILFKFYYARLMNDETYAQEGFEMIQRCIEKVQNDKQVIFSYCDGFSGLGWVLDHLEMEDFLETNNDLMFSQLDPFLHERMLLSLENGKFDFLHGAMGVAFYFLGRYKNTKKEDLKNRYKGYLLDFIRLLKETSEESEGAYKWQSILNYKIQNKGYDTGLAHGAASILAFLMRLYYYKDFREKCEPIMKGIINYLLALQNENHQYQFPSSVSLNGEKNLHGRLAWCYGDLGIGLQLLKSSRLLKNKNLEQKAISILEATTKYKDVKETLVVDASMCHGSFGVAQLYRQIFKETNKNIFKEATNYWMQDGLKKAIHSDGFAGYKQKHGDVWENEISLLEGISGIGLVIIDHLSKESNRWDESFMIS